MLLDQIGEGVKSSLLLNLYADGFSFDDQEALYRYSRMNTSVSDSINLTVLPGQVDQLLMRADQYIQKVLKEKPENGSKDSRSDFSPITYYNGGIIVEIRDYREGRGIYNEAEKTITPYSFKLFLKPDCHALHYHLDSLQASISQKLIFEQNVLLAIHPDLYLDPSIKTNETMSSLHYSINKFNTNTKAKTNRKKKCLVASRRYFKSTKEPVKKNPGLISFLKRTNFAREYMKEIDSISLKNERRNHAPLYVPQTPIRSTPSHPSIVGKFLFNSPLYKSNLNPQPNTPQEFMAIETKGAGNTHPPYEMYHLILKISNNAKALHVALGGPNATLRFLNQLKKIEKPATPEQLKSYNEHLKMQQYHMFQASQKQSISPHINSNVVSHQQFAPVQHQIQPNRPHHLLLPQQRHRHMQHNVNIVNKGTPGQPMHMANNQYPNVRHNMQPMTHIPYQHMQGKVMNSKQPPHPNVNNYIYSPNVPQQ